MTWRLPRARPHEAISTCPLADAPAPVLPSARRALLDLGPHHPGQRCGRCRRRLHERRRRLRAGAVQFGRVIGTYQAVKHHCANMYVASEVATAAVWDAARAAAKGDEQFGYAQPRPQLRWPHPRRTSVRTSTSRCTAVSATPGNTTRTFICAVGLTMYALLDPDHAAEEITDLTRRGVVRAKTIQLPPEAETVRSEVRAFLATIDGHDAAEKRRQPG